MSLFDDISKFGTIAEKTKTGKAADVVGTFIKMGEAQIEAIAADKKNKKGVIAGLWYKKIGTEYDILLKVGVFPLMVKDGKAVKVRVPNQEAACGFVMHAVTLAEEGELSVEFADVAVRKAEAKKAAAEAKIAKFVKKPTLDDQMEQVAQIAAQGPEPVLEAGKNLVQQLRERAAKKANGATAS